MVTGEVAKLWIYFDPAVQLLGTYPQTDKCAPRNMYKYSQPSVTMAPSQHQPEAKEHLPTSDREHVFLFTSVSVQHSLFTADTFLFLACTYVCNTHKCFSKGNVSSTIGAHEMKENAA